MKKINVLFLMPQMGMGGSERLVHNLVLRLDRSQFSPSVAWLYGSEALPEFRDLRVPLYHIPKTKRVDLSTMQGLAKIIQTEDVDVVSAQHFMPAIYAYYGCNVAAKKALVFTAHSRWEIEDTPLKWRVAGGYLLRRIGASVGVTPDVSSAIQRVFRIKASHVVTIENGVELDLFLGDKDVRGLRGSLGLADDDVVIGIVANLKTVKNHLFLLQAFSTVAREKSGVKLLIVGQGFPGEPDNTERTLRSYVDDHGLAESVSFLGFRPDIAELLRVMDVFCLTSLREGLPISLIEAMAAGLPAVGTDVEGIRDVITPDEDGILVGPGDVAAMTDAIIRLIVDPAWRLRLGRAGREKAVRKYSLERCVRQYEQLFLSLANARACR
jgi:glycosyltransferase involved in cell wall biosynthesis